MCELSVCALKRYFTPFFANTRAKRAVKKSSPKMAKTKKTQYRKGGADDGVRPGTSKRHCRREVKGLRSLKKRVSIQNGFHF